MTSRGKLILQIAIPEFNNILHENCCLPKQLITDDNVSPPTSKMQMNSLAEDNKTLPEAYIVDHGGTKSRRK